jgi:hypothetical protein
LPERTLTETCQKKKAVALLILASIFFLIVCLGLRFVPTINDAVYGEPEYMRWIADRFARSLASKVGEDFAIIAVRDEKKGCQQVGNITAFNEDDLYYVLSYSEQLHSLCFLTYAKPLAGSNHSEALVLTQESGRNYGHKLDAPVKVVPVGHVNVTFPVSYLSLLHWRARIDPSTFGRVGDATVQRSLAELLSVSFVDVSINFGDLRAAVADRHNSINSMLTSVIFISLLLTSFGAVRAWTLYRSFRAFLVRYDAQVGFGTFLSDDLRRIGSRAHEAHQQREKRLLEQARAAILLKRSKEAIRGRLESMRNALPDAQQRLRVQDCLDRDDFDEMRTLVQALQGQAGQKTPEERLTSLLDTLQEHCTSEELDRCCTEAFQILATTGFRQARSFVVGAHDQFRVRSKELEKQELVETE